jgi:tRNA pseudouridine38-40 synthase
LYNYKLIIEYDGLCFNGWQKQTYTDNTIQQQLEVSIGKLLKKEIRLIAAGRTDSRVSAYNQTANFFYEKRIDPAKFIHSLNSILPGEITVKRISKVSKDFHSRFSAKKREYIYKITTEKKSVGKEFYHRIKHNPDFKKIDIFIDFVKNLNSFTSLCKNKEDRHNFACIIYNLSYRIYKAKKEIIFTVCANRFLHSMVRAIIGCALEIGKEKSDLDSILQKIKNGEKFRINYLPANALFLKKIYY